MSALRCYCAANATDRHPSRTPATAVPDAASSTKRHRAISGAHPVATDITKGEKMCDKKIELIARRMSTTLARQGAMDLDKLKKFMPLVGRWDALKAVDLAIYERWITVDRNGRLSKGRVKAPADKNWTESAARREIDHEIIATLRRIEDSLATLSVAVGDIGRYLIRAEEAPEGNR